jgi:serine/threonine-protein kinase
VQDLNETGSATRLEGTGGTTPFFSPDGKSLGYLNGGGIEIVPLNGGKPRSLVTGVSTVGGSATWASDGSVYFVDATTGIDKVAATGGSPESVKAPSPAEEYAYPQLLPGGRYLLHHIWHKESGRRSIAVTEIATGEQKIVFEGGFAPRYVPTGHLLVAQEDLLLGMTFDLETLEVGAPVPVLRGLATDFGDAMADYAVSESGSLVYITGALEKEGWLVRLTLGNRPERLNRQPADFSYLSCDVSPDGRRVAVDRNDFDIWIFDLESRDFEVRLTTDPALDWTPVWEPTGDGVTFVSLQGGRFSLRSRRANGLGEVRPLLEDRDVLTWPRSWSPDGETLLFEQFDRETHYDVWLVEAGRPAAARPFLDAPFNEGSAAFSPNGAWVAYMSDESGRFEVYVTSYPDRTIKRKVSRDGGGWPRWGADSDRLFYSSRNRVMVVRTLDAQWTPSQPEVFVEGVDALLTWDVTADGKSVIALEQRPALRLHLVQNWFEELKRRVPVDR